MKKALLFCVLTIFVCSNASYSFAQATTKADEKTIAFLKSFRTDCIASILDKKPALMQTYYAEDIRLMTESQRTIIGSKNVLQYHEAFLKRFQISNYNRGTTEILDLGSMVVENGTFTMRMISVSIVKEYNVEGKYMNVWAKRAGDKLSLLTEAWNYNQPLDMQGQLRFDEIPVQDVALQAHLPITDNTRFELAALNRLMEVTITQHDAKTWCRFYSDSAILFTQRNRLYAGRKDIDDYIEMHVKEFPVFEKLDIRNDRVDDLGNFVIEYASHIAIWRSGESSGIGLGKDIRIWKRENSGSLKIYRHIGMYD